MKDIILAGGLFIALALAGGAASGQTPGQSSDKAHMSEFARTAPPVGYTQFCRLHPEDCSPLPASAERVRLTQEAWEQLVDVNDYVNATVEPATDMELYGVEEWWTYPIDNRGDCEDYVLLKRKLLMELGWPASALLITVVRDEYGDGHAILTVSTTQGDLILDNQALDIRLWSETPYSYLKRQSASAPETWVSLRRSPARPDVPVAGFDRH